MGAASTSSSVATSSSFAAFQIHKKCVFCSSFLHDWNHPSLPPPPLLPPQPPPPPPRPPPPAPAFCQHSGCPGLDKTLVYGSALALAFFLISSNIFAWSVFKMNVHVNFKMRSYCERECTHWASVGFLSSLLYFGLGCERHSSEFCENLAAVDWCFQCRYSFV